MKTMKKFQANYLPHVRMFRVRLDELEHELTPVEFKSFIDRIRDQPPGPIRFGVEDESQGYEFDVVERAMVLEYLELVWDSYQRFITRGTFGIGR